MGNSEFARGESGLVLIFDEPEYTLLMTTITLDTSVKLPKSHFRDMDELAQVLLQWRFEQELDVEMQQAKKLPKSDWQSL